MARESDPETSGSGWLEQSEDAVLKHLLETDRPDWENLASHPAFHTGWVAFFLKRNRPIAREVLQEIFSNRAFLRDYLVIRNLYRCPSVPVGLAMNLVSRIRWVDLVHAMRDPYLTGPLRRRAEQQVLKIFPGLAEGQKVQLAKMAPRCMIVHLRALPERMLIRHLMLNHFFTHEDALFVASYPKISPMSLTELASCPRWSNRREIRRAILCHTRVPRAAVMKVARTIPVHEIQSLLASADLAPVSRQVLSKRVPATRPGHRRP